MHQGGRSEIYPSRYKIQCHLLSRWIRTLCPDTKKISPLPRTPYRIQAKLASGGIGELWLASRSGNEETLFVLKRALPHLANLPEIQEMLHLEARRTQAVRSPHVIRFHELLSLRHEPVLALEYHHGVDLSSLLEAAARDRVHLPLQVKLRILQDALRGLSAIHETWEGDNPLIYGDFHPQNIVVGIDGITKLCDLGLTIPEGTALPPGLRGVAAYTAPEVWQQKEQTRRSDIFSAGIVLWEVLREERLFLGDSQLSTLQNTMEAPIPRLAQGHLNLQPYTTVVSNALNRDPASRPPTGKILLESLQGISGHTSTREVSEWVQRLVGIQLRNRLVFQP